MCRRLRLPSTARRKHTPLTRTATIALLSVVLPSFYLVSAQDATDRKQEAWKVLREGVNEKETSKRAQAVRVLGLLPGYPVAAEMAEKALTDEKPEVRAAAAIALGQMDSRASIPKLEGLLSDKEPSVALAAASALAKFKDQSAFDVYYEVLTGERKASKGLIAAQVETSKDPKKLAEMGFDEGVGFVPFAAIGG